MRLPCAFVLFALRRVNEQELTLSLLVQASLNGACLAACLAAKVQVRTRWTNAVDFLDTVPMTPPEHGPRPTATRPRLSSLRVSSRPRDTDCQHYGRFTTGATSCVPGERNSDERPRRQPRGGSNNNRSGDDGGDGGDGGNSSVCTIPPSLEYFSSTDAAAPGGMAVDGRPSSASIRQWNPSGFPHPKAMLAGPVVASVHALPWYIVCCC